MARKSRKNMMPLEATALPDKEKKVLFKAGLYARLSHETEENIERGTIETQMELMKNYVKDHEDIVIEEEYYDASFTGTNFERPDFKRMLEDAKTGRINCIIVKDLSRLGRNYVEMGNYIERVFPFLNVRFIAVTDDFDSFRPGTDLMMPLKNIVNEFYAKDISKKVSTAHRRKWTTDEYMCGFAPYGYLKSKTEKNRIVVDEATAGNVRLGKLIWNKTKKRVGSNNTSTYVPKDEWIVIENCHEPIITQKLFDTAHANSKKYIRPKRGKRNYNPFYYCGVCGRALVPSKRVKGDILLCSSSRIEENSPCKSNRVEIAKVEDAIMKTVNMYATAYLDEKGIKKAGKSKEVSPEEKIATLEKKVKSLSSKKMMLYSDYKDDKLTREEYVKRSKAMVEQIDELHQEIEQLKTEIPPEDNSSSKFETQLESIINMESFDREKIQKVIKKVIINGEDNIEIVWNTDDPFFK
mgnify:CR=1 FL=1